MNYFYQDEIDDNKKNWEHNRYMQHIIALHFFKRENVLWREWHEYMIASLEEIGLVPNMALSRGGPFKSSTHYITYKGTKRKLEKFNYEGLTDCSFTVTNVIGGGVSDYKANVSLDLGADYHNADEITKNKESISYIISEEIKKFSLNEFLKLAKKLHYFTKAEYGYYLQFPESCNPDCYMIGSDYYSTTKREYERNKKWNAIQEIKSYDEVLEMRYKYLRDIYRLNFLSKRHLDLVYNDKGEALLDFIKKDELGAKWELIELSEDFYCWHIERSDLFYEIIQTLSKIVICNYDNLDEE